MKWRAMLIALALPLPLLVVAACGGPVSTTRAYEECSERARLAERPRGSVGMGVGSGTGSGTRAVSDVNLTISSDFLTGRDPYLVYEQCFRRMTGAGPTRPLIL